MSSLSIDRLVRSTITRNSRILSGRSFGVAMIAAYFPTSIFSERVREYTEPAEMLADGFSEEHPAYLAAVKLCSQEPGVERFKVGRRGGSPTQILRFVPSTPAAGDEYSITFRGVTFTVTADSSPSVAEVIDSFVALMTADADGIATSHATAVTEVDVTTFDGVLGGTLSPSRNVTLTLNSHADWDATTGTVTGYDAAGRPQTESFTIPNGGNTTLTGTKIWSRITQVAIPAQSGTNGTFTVGVGVKFDEDTALVFTPTDNTTSMDLASAAGAWNQVTDLSSNLTVHDRTVEPGTTLATDLDAIRGADADFVVLLVADVQSSAQILAVAAWAEDKRLAYFADTSDSDVEDDVSTDIASTLIGLGYFHTLLHYSRVNHGMFAAGDAGHFLAGLFKAGDRRIIEGRQLAGVSPDDITPTVETRLLGPRTSPASGKRVVLYLSRSAEGSNQALTFTNGGLTPGGEWIDIVVGLFRVDSEIQSAVVARQLASPPPSFDAEGIAIVEAAVRRALFKCAADPIRVLRADTISTSTTAIEDVSDTDLQNRFYDGVKWDAKTRGAMQAIDVGGTVEP